MSPIGPLTGNSAQTSGASGSTQVTKNMFLQLLVKAFYRELIAHLKDARRALLARFPDVSRCGDRR